MVYYIMVYNVYESFWKDSAVLPFDLSMTKGDKPMLRKENRTLTLAFLLILAWATAMAEKIEVRGKVAEIEKHGHARLNITIEDFNNAGFVLGDVVTVTAGNYTGDMPYLNGYYVERGEPMVRAYPGYTNIAVCIN